MLSKVRVVYHQVIIRTKYYKCRYSKKHIYQTEFPKNYCIASQIISKMLLDIYTYLYIWVEYIVYKTYTNKYKKPY